MALPTVGDIFRMPTADGLGREYEVTGVGNDQIPPYVALRPPSGSGRRDYGQVVHQDEWDEWEARAKKLN